MESARDYLFRISVCPGNFSPHVRESKTLLDSGFHAVDSGFHLLDSRSFSVELGFRIRIVSGIPDSYTCIPDSKAQDSGFHKQKFPRFRIPNAKISRILESGFLYMGRNFPVGRTKKSFTLYIPTGISGNSW